jgi:hypothetical protein
MNFPFFLLLFLSTTIFSINGYKTQKLPALRNINRKFIVTNDCRRFSSLSVRANSIAIPVGDGASQNVAISFPSTLQNIHKTFVQVTWISWWFQIILSVISGVILVFANTVRGPGAYSIWASGFSLSCIGTVISLVNSFWTWNVTRLLRRFTTKKIKEDNFLPTLRKYARTSIILSLVGMLITLVGAEQIVGTLASKVLSNQGFSPVLIAQPGLASSTTLQALDIFLVQANTNCMVAHFTPLLFYLSLLTQMPQIEFKDITQQNPPSQLKPEEKPRASE